jgi:hypothetical protein
MNINRILQEVADGNSNPLEAYIQFKKLEKELENAIKAVQADAINEAAKYPEKSFKAFGAVIEKRNAPSKWTYDHISAWISAKENLKRIETLAQAGGAVDEESGEVIDRAIKVHGKETIALTSFYDF